MNSPVNMKETDSVIIDIYCHSPKPIQEGTDSTPTDSETVSSSGATTNELAQSKCVGAIPSPDAKNEKRKTMSGKKPPRPPRGLSLDAADQRLIKELSELAMIKRAARIQRIKRMKAANASSSSSMAAASSSSAGNIIAVVFTLLFCLVIIFRGCHLPGNLLRNNSSAGIASSSIVMVGEESNLLRKRID